jgi:hypothetical protein
MKDGFRVIIVCAVLLVTGMSQARAQIVSTQPSQPLANSPFLALVNVGGPFDSGAGFDPTTLNAQGNTIFVDFYLCYTQCSFTAGAGPYPLQLPALPPGDYTLEVGIVGFSPNPPPQLFPFSVSAVAATPVTLPALSTWGLIGLLGGLIAVALCAIRRRAPIRN